MEKVIRCRAGEEENGKSVLFVMRNRLGLSDRQIRRAKYRPQGIRLAGERVRTDASVHSGDLLEVLVETASEGSAQLVPSETDPVIVWEDEDLVIVNKPAGLAAHPSRGHFAETLANQIYGYYRRRGEEIRVRTAGRLDMDTSGLLAFAKNAPASAMYDRLHREGKIRRTYLALVEGVPDPPEGCIRYPLARVRRKLPDGREMDLSAPVIHPDGGVLNSPAPATASDGGTAAPQEAVTFYRVLQTYPYREKAPLQAAGRDPAGQSEPAGDPGKMRTPAVYSLVELILGTGRMHQIRAHMATIGHPLLGDTRYGPEAALTAEERAAYPALIGRTALHAARLSGVSPLTREPFDLRAELPPVMKRLTEEEKDEG